MPEKIIRKFQKEYGTKKNKNIFYTTTNSQNRNPETFKKKNCNKVMRAK